MQRNLTRRELATAVTDSLGISHRSASVIVDAVFENLKTTLVSGESVKLVQFGSLLVRAKAPRRGRNPRTGNAMTITERKMVSFRPSKRMRDLLNPQE